MPTSNSSISVGSSVVAEVVGLRDHNGVYQNDATVELLSLVHRATGEAVGGLTLPITLDYVADSNGNYEAQLPYDMDIKVGDILEATFRAISSSNYRKQWTEVVRVKRAT